MKDGIIKQLSKRGEKLKDALTKLVKMTKYPRLVEMVSKLLTAETDASQLKV